MVKIFQPDQLEKTHFSIVYRLYLHNVGIFQPSQTLEIFSICFLLLYGVMTPKIFVPVNSQKLPDDFQYPQTGDFINIGY